MTTHDWQVGDVVKHVRSRYRRLANPAKAAPMAAYMKTNMPFYGVQKPARTGVFRELVARFPIHTRQRYEDVVMALWKLPHREEKYLAVHVACHCTKFIVPASLPLYRRLIRQGAWWDFVDDLAIRAVGSLVLDHPHRLEPDMDRWIDDGDMWIRRTAIICRIKHKQHTDEARLFDYCLRRAHEQKFFIRKAIGWALREHSKTAPDRVRRFLAIHGDQLSKLSRREAAKRLP